MRLDEVAQFTDVVIWQESNPDVEFRIVGRHAIGVSYRVVEYRYYPDKHGCWSDWCHHTGFELEEVIADDWEWRSINDE